MDQNEVELRKKEESQGAALDVVLSFVALPVVGIVVGILVKQDTLICDLFAQLLGGSAMIRFGALLWNAKSTLTDQWYVWFYKCQLETARKIRRFGAAWFMVGGSLICLLTLIGLIAEEV